MTRRRSLKANTNVHVALTKLIDDFRMKRLESMDVEMKQETTRPFGDLSKIM
jgi:hypothetical protein